MAVDNERSIPSSVLDAIKAAGYDPDQSMAAHIAGWWDWYTAKAGWYDKAESVNGRRFKTRRATLHPARFVCREWASLILDDDGTKVTADEQAAGDALAEWAADTRFISTAQRALERAFGLGTGALALWFDIREDGAEIRARRYDARMVVPLSWDDDGVTECAFVTDAQESGRRVVQLQMHVLSEETGTYHVITRMFDAETGGELHPDDLIADLDTRTDAPTFAILRPAIDNVFADGTYMGQSVFADAVDAIKGVDNAYDSMQREIDATKVKVFMSSSLFDLYEDEDGKKRPIPMSPENTFIVKVEPMGADDMCEVFAPPIRVQALADALNVSLSQLGTLTGFGQNYLRYDKQGGLKTATEVSADNSALMRNIRKHENELRPQLEKLLTCALACQREFNGWPVPEGCAAHIDFDDSIITDTQAEKAMFQNEIALRIAQPWEYRMRFYGEGEDEAREKARPEVSDMGF